MTRPLLFLDVDGVINVVPPVDGEPTYEVEGFPICVPRAVPDRVRRLLEVCEPVWATTWRGDAHRYFHEILGIGKTPWRHIEFNELKLLSIINHAAEAKVSGVTALPWIWIDDDAKWEMGRLGLWSDRVHTLTINPEPSVGLTDGHVEEALAFVGKLNGGSDEGS